MKARFERLPNGKFAHFPEGNVGGRPVIVFSLHQAVKPDYTYQFEIQLCHGETYRHEGIAYQKAVAAGMKEVPHDQTSEGHAALMEKRADFYSQGALGSRLSPAMRAKLESLRD